MAYNGGTLLFVRFLFGMIDVHARAIPWEVGQCKTLEFSSTNFQFSLNFQVSIYKHVELFVHWFIVIYL